jgi:putative radical SAM enzyme (TIGR03279 family)
MEVISMVQRAHIIKTVEAGSIAEEMNVRPGDVLLEINKSPVQDIIEYKYLINEEYIEVLIQKPSGEQWLLEIDKEFHEDLGLVFETGLMDLGKRCKNKCMFCFIDQLPGGMRESLYFKDDDSRLSFLQGNFISLTNLETEDIDRIIKYRISPLNISVHTTEPQLRSKLLGNPKAGEAIKLMSLFLEHGLVLNCQIVLCPGLNDGQHLEKSLRDLESMGRGIDSIGVVPVGITKYREGLYPLKYFNKEDANNALNIVGKWQKRFLHRYGSRIVYAADELYLKAGLPLPAAGAYEHFPQLENGIGMMALFREQFESQYKMTAWDKQRPRKVSVATGQAAYGFVKKITAMIEGSAAHLKADVYPITNNFFGETIDVAGLVTGRDLINQLAGINLGDKLLIPQSMLKSGEDIFLDDISVTEVQGRLNTKVEICQVHGGEFLRKIVREEEV